MSRTQKIVLVAFALTDVLVIALLGYLVFSSQASADSEATDQTSEPCGILLLEELSDISTYHPAVAYDQSRRELYITLRTATTSAKASDVEGPQSLWTALTVVAPPSVHLCPSAETLVLTVEITAFHGPVYHVARFPAPMVSDWVAGEISDEQLAIASGYRYIPRHPQESVPSGPQD